MNHIKLKGFQNIVAHTFYPLTLGSGMFLSWYLFQKGYPSFQAMVIPVIILNAFVWLTEFYLPYNKNWRPNKQILKVDITHALVASLLVTPFLKMLLLVILERFNLGVSGLKLWPHNLPIAIQVILAIIITDFLIYICHRWMHSSKLGWRIHVVHHSTEKMNFWAASRTHPLNSILVYSTEVGVLLLLGINFEALTVWTVFMSVSGLLSHSNIDLRLGIINKLLTTPAVHRVHHSTNWSYSNSNFGSTTCLWDHIFKTYQLPEEPVKQQGIKMHKIPENYIEHIKAPFILDHYKTK